MSVASTVKTYSMSLVSIGIAMAVIFFVLSFLHNRGPAFMQGPAQAIGSTVSGQRFGY